MATSRSAEKSRAVYIDRKGNIARLVMNRPEVLNAQNWQLANDMHRCLDELESARDLQAVILCGAGRAFSSGIDLKALSAGELKIDWFKSFDEAMRRVECLDALTVARIQGYALGGGLQISLACDFRIAAADARLGLPAVLEALIPGMGTYRLPRFIGLGRARRMVLTGEMITAKEALKIGLVDWVVPASKLDKTTHRVIEATLKGSPTVRGLAKTLLNASFHSSFGESFAAYLDYQQRSLDSEDHRRAISDYSSRKK